MYLMVATKRKENQSGSAAPVLSFSFNMNCNLKNIYFLKNIKTAKCYTWINAQSANVTVPRPNDVPSRTE